MDPKENGALPSQGRGFVPGHGDSIPVFNRSGEIVAWMEPLGGLTKREHFAAMAMQGLALHAIGGALCDSEHRLKYTALEAVRIADALLRALAAGGEG